MNIENNIKQFENFFSSEKFKDGGQKFVNELAKFIHQLTDAEKSTYYNFFIEKVYNEDINYYSLSLALIEAINDDKLNNKLFYIYQKSSMTKSEQWKNEILFTLLKMKYTEKGDIYNDFIVRNYIKQPLWSLHKIALYCLINENKGIILLSDYFKKYMQTNNYSPNEISGKELFLFNIFEKKPSLLVKLLSSLNDKESSRLKKMLLNYLNSDFKKKIKKEVYIKLLNLVT